MEGAELLSGRLGIWECHWNKQLLGNPTPVTVTAVISLLYMLWILLSTLPAEVGSTAYLECLLVTLGPHGHLECSLNTVFLTMLCSESKVCLNLNLAFQCLTCPIHSFASKHFSAEGRILGQQAKSIFV